ncbi:MAG: DnaJ domain-containing protein [Roseibium sp.]
MIGLVLLVLGVAAARSFVQANPAALAQSLRTYAGIFLLVLSVVFAFTGRIALAIPAFGFGVSLLGLARMRRVSGYNPQKSSGQQSHVRTAMLEMDLDHDTGDLSGTILAGGYQGRRLDDLSDDDLEAFWQETASDDQSRKLVEAYLDRRLASWRENFEPDGADRQGSATSSGPMTNEEAYQILGLSPVAGDAEIRTAHRRLMKRVHPDQGGSSFLAAKINEAKDTLLRRH